jgi:hypothetical protein
VNPLKQWRPWVLALLLIGPVLLYTGLGTLWLWERGWKMVALGSAMWIVTGSLFSILAMRWTKSRNPLMPPLDWDTPQTFSPIDRDAWNLVQREADLGESLTYESLMGGDVYIETGRRLLKHIAEHYHPSVSNPLDDVPLVELLTAIELASEDLSKLSRQVPGGDMITLSHWRRAVQVAGYINKANELYSYVLPFINPAGGLARWGTRQWIVKPAWKSMQQNILRWFYQAYVNRVGVHLIELMSGRLAIGSDQYRRLTRKYRNPTAVLESESMGPLTIAVAGTKGSGKTRLIEAFQKLLAEDTTALKAKLGGLVAEPSIIERLRQMRWVEIPAYPSSSEPDSRRTDTKHEMAVQAALSCDLLMLVVTSREPNHEADVRFAKIWDRWFLEHPHHQEPPTITVLTAVDQPEWGEEWQPPYNWLSGQSHRESVVRSRFDALRAVLPPTFTSYVAVGLKDASGYGVLEHVLPALTAEVHRAERTALIRKLHEVGSQSRAGRLVRQLGVQGRSLWTTIRSRHTTGAGSVK